MTQDAGKGLRPSVTSKTMYVMFRCIATYLFLEQ